MTLIANTPKLDVDRVAVQTAERAERGTNPDGSKASLGSSLLSLLVMIAMAVIFLLPLYWMILSSLKSDAELAQYPPTLWPWSWDFQNYVNAVQATPFLRFFVNSVIITGSVVVLSVLSNFIVAYGFSCIDWPGRDKVFYLVIATLFLPFPVTLIPMFDMWARLGLVNTQFPLILPAMFGSAFFVFLLRQFMRQVPAEMLSAARIDGASEWRIMWRLVFPMCKPALTAVAIFAAVASWNDFMGPLIYLNDESIQTLSIGLQTFRTVERQEISFGELMAATVLVLLPLLVLFIAFQRHFVRGITFGGFK